MPVEFSADPRVGAVPGRFLTKKLLPLQCLVTGERHDVELRLADLPYWPWWLYPASLLSLGLVRALVLDDNKQRLWLPLSTAGWRWTKWRWSRGVRPAEDSQRGRRAGASSFRRAAEHRRGSGGHRRSASLRARLRRGLLKLDLSVRIIPE